MKSPTYFAELNFHPSTEALISGLASRAHEWVFWQITEARQFEMQTDFPLKNEISSTKINSQTKHMRVEIQLKNSSQTRRASFDLGHFSSSEILFQLLSPVFTPEATLSAPQNLAKALFLEHPDTLLSDPLKGVWAQDLDAEGEIKAPLFAEKLFKTGTLKSPSKNSLNYCFHYEKCKNSDGQIGLKGELSLSPQSDPKFFDALQYSF